MLYKILYCSQLNNKDFNITAITAVGGLLCRYLPFCTKKLILLFFYKLLNINCIYIYTKSLSNKNKTRMITFIKTKFKNSDNQMNIYKYRVAANVTQYH